MPRSDHIDAPGARQTKSPVVLPPGFHSSNPSSWRYSWQHSWHSALGSSPLLRRRLVDAGLERLVGLLRHARVELADLGRLRYELLVGRLEIVALHFDRVVNRLGAEQLLRRRRAVLECLAGVVGHLDRDRLEALRQRTERRQRRIHVVLAELLHVLEILDHGSFPLKVRWLQVCARWGALMGRHGAS